MTATGATRPISPFGRLLRAKDPAQLLEETLEELESDSSVPPEKGQALRRPASFLPYADAKGIQALEAGRTPPSPGATAEDSFTLSRARELAAIFGQRREKLHLSFTHPKPRVHALPITPEEDGPENVDAIDLVAAFQSILHRIRTRDASLPQSH